MENKINIAELLKDCPKGMELDCTMYENVVLDSVCKDNSYPINLLAGDMKLNLTKGGCYSNSPEAKCVIFPKGKTTWEGFAPPCQFKDGDVVFYDDTIAIFKKWIDETLFRTYVIKYLYKDSAIIRDVPLFGKSVRKEIRFATEEEKQNLFDAIKANGYKWNAETKILEKLPKFKVGDRIRHKITNKDDIYEISKVYDDSYGLVDYTWMLYMEYQDNYELVPNKFDITTLKPFESRVLVRYYYNRMWVPTYWGKYLEDNSDCLYLTTNGRYKHCIPYEGNEHLLGTINDCDEYYKTWE